MARPSSNGDPAPDVVALHVLAWLVGDGDRLARLLDLTGLDGAGIRARTGDPALQAAILRHVTAHEPDLVACADALGIEPGAITAALAKLEE